MAGALIAAWSPASRLKTAMGLRNALFVAVAALFALAVTALAAGLKYPDLVGRVTDQAGLLTPADHAEIESQLAALEQTSTDQLAVVTVKSLEGYAIEDYGIGLAGKWGIGQKGKDNGILLIVAPNDREVRIEVGRRLEPMMTDTMSTLIIENAILPEFRRGNFSAGIRAGVRDIKDVLSGDAEEVKERRAATRGDALDFWSIVLIVFWLCVVLFVLFAVVQSISNLASGWRPSAPRRRSTIPRRLGRGVGGCGGGGMVGRRRRFRRRRLFGELVTMPGDERKGARSER